MEENKCQALISINISGLQNTHLKKEKPNDQTQNKPYKMNKLGVPIIFALATIALLSTCKKDDDTNSNGKQNIPELTTVEATAITQTTARSGGNIIDDGGASVTARGVCWSTNQNPTTSDNKTEDGTGVGSFTSSLSGLELNTTYYVRAYATNSEGTAYGNAVSFKTLEAIALPGLTTTDVTAITRTTAVSGGNITDDGGAPVTARGICWSKNENPTTSDSKTEDGTGTGSFTSNITGLEPNTTYYARAYATNETGTAYGDQQIFTTAAPLSWGINNFTQDHGLAGHIVKSIAVDESNNIWAGTNSGLSKFDGVSWTSYTEADGIALTGIQALSFDPDGNLWIGTWENGLFKFDGQTWINYSEDDGLFSNRVYSIYADNSSNIWIGTKNNHLTIFDGSSFNSFAVNPQTDPDGNIVGHIHAIYADHDENMWVGSCYTGLSMYDGDSWTNYINNLNSFINAIYCTSEGHIWVGQSPLGAFSYANGNWENYPESETMIQFVYAVSEDANGNVWIGGRDGVSVLQENTWEYISAEDGLINTTINTLVGDHEGSVWVGGPDGLSQIYKLED